MANPVRAKGHLLRLLNEMSREAGHSLEGKLNRRLGKILGKPVSKTQIWVLLAEEYARRKGISLSLGKPKGPRIKKSARLKISSSDVFYNSREWRAVRFQALKQSDGCCELCGESKRSHGIVLHVDHIKPRSKRPDLALALSNLQILCAACNLGKSNTDDTDWREGAAGRSLDSFDWRTL